MNNIKGINFSSFPVVTPSNTNDNMEVGFPSDVYEFYQKIAQANETLHRMKFLNLRSQVFSYEITSYSELETTIMFGYKELFIQQFKPEFFDLAFSTALFFKQSEILKLLLEQAMPEQRFFALDCLFYFPEFDELIFQYERKIKAVVLPSEQLYASNFLARVNNLRTFCSCYATQTKVLEESIDDEKKFYLLWNRADPSMREAKDPNGETLLSRAILKCKSSIVQFLLNNGANVKTFTYIKDTPLKLARSSFAGDPLLRELERRDEGFTNHVEQMEELGHRIALTMKVPFIQGILKKDSHRLVDAIITSITAFSSQTDKCKSSSFSAAKIGKFTQSLSVAKERRAVPILELAKKNCAVVQGGWANHFVSYIYGIELIQGIHNKTSFCIKINTSSPTLKGLRFYEIENTNSLNLQRAIRDGIVNSITMAPVSIGEDHFENGLDKQLSLKKIAEIEFAQDEPNCNWMALKAAFLGLLIIDEIASQNSPLAPASIHTAHASVRKFFDAWEEWDLMHSFAYLKQMMHLYPSLFEENLTFGHMIKKLLSRGLETSIYKLVQLDTSLVFWKDEMNKTLIRYAYRQNMAYLFVLLIKFKVDLRICDLLGKTLEDDIAAKPSLLMAILKNASAFQLTDSEIHTLSQYLPKQSG